MGASRSFVLPLASGRLWAREWGKAGDPVALCVPGLTMNAHSFEVIGGRLATAARRAVALDLRGRGESEATPPGTYGWRRHAEDVLGAADELGADRFDILGHSMGAFVAMQAAVLHPGRVQRIVLIDAAGVPERGTRKPIRRAMERLGRTYRSADDFLDEVRRSRAMPWTPVWERAFRHELVAVPGGVRSRTSLAAILEDVAYGALHDPRQLWPGVRARVLLVRARIPLRRRKGFIVSAADRDRLVAMVPNVEVLEVSANHYGVMTLSDTAEAIAQFLS